jgi:anti-sigma factor RsiW
MKTPSLRDIEQLSAILDAELSRTEVVRLGARIRQEPELAAAYLRLRQVRSLLRSQPKRRAPRNFILTPKMAGLRPPLPRSVPTLSWASVAAMLLFVVTLGTNTFGRFSFGFGAAAPMAVEAPMMLESVPADNAAPDTYAAGGTELQTTPTPETMTLRMPEATLVPEEFPVEPPAVKAEREPADPWLLIWPGLAATLLAAAGLVRWNSLRVFRKRTATRNTEK